MPVPTLQSRSSTDFGIVKPQTLTASHQLTRSHPPRLQHSPSLPNLWSPPPSGLLPSGMSVATQDDQNPSNCPSTPPTPTSHPPLKTPPMSSAKYRNDEVVSALEKLSLKGNDARRNVTKTTLLHTRKRHRKDRDPSHHLLTPPLTPSSSIRTTASTESVDGKYENKLELLRELQEPEATRFLYLENVSRTISPASLQSAITNALSHISSCQNPKAPCKTINPGDVNGQSTSCIKGFFLRHLETTGTLFLAFHDVRDALAAKTVLSHRSDGPVAGCLGEMVLTDGTPGWFRCHFITAEELVGTIGNSNFLATTDGGFSLSVTITGDSDAEGAHTHGLDATRAVDAHMLVKILESYGDLRLFRPERQDNNNEWTFIVEFFDVRGAREAYTALSDQVMFGMKLDTSGLVTPNSQVGDSASHVFPSKQGQDRSDTPQSSHQPSASESHIPKLASGIGPAGKVSQMRGPFVGQNTKSRPRAVSVGNETTLSPSPPRSSDRPPNTSSPTIFYTSFDFHNSHSDIPLSGHGRPTNDQTLGYIENHNETSEQNEGQIKAWEPQQTCSIIDCCYCPSKGHDLSVVQSQLNHHPNPPFANPVPFSAQSPSPVFVGPSEYEPHRIFPATNWTFDPSLIVPNLTANIDMFGTAYIPAIPVVPVEHRFPEQNPGLIPNGIVYNVIPPMLHVQPHSFAEPQPMITSDQHIYVNNSAEASQDPDSSLKSTASAAGVGDRNFLNVARIEEGLDTRTTVMIKNIPNKMTAKDLVQYIGDVRPRTIDFLYLRMDFKNGCNVGYAFVNFIRVQDMLTFAKERLGVKWNMFSSEKVLQMSYANYQGKEALVEKFKNSCIMDEREEWRPRIFYSCGLEQGLPEPFPAPTHLRRKERSSHNRGALYVPGAGSTNTSVYLTNGPLRRQDYYSTSGSKYLEHRSKNMDRNAEGVQGGGRKSRISCERSR